LDDLVARCGGQQVVGGARSQGASRYVWHSQRRKRRRANSAPLKRLPYCGGIRVIHTPGHTVGHVCLYHEQSRTLIAVDALNVDGGVLRPSSPAMSYDALQALASLRALATVDIGSVVCYHGGLYRDEPNERIAGLWQPSLSSE
jgi:glyoxylase-like metal-dependent hydrolase (beta-lactamase superfamily II)